MAKATILAPHGDPGSALRRLRSERGWTLAYVAERTGLPLSTVSKIETGKVALTYDKLSRICRGLGIDMVDLLSPDTNGEVQNITGRRSITRAGDGKAIETTHYLHRYPAADFLKKRFVPIVAEVRARTLEEFGEMIRHPGEEYAYVLEGAIELHTEHYAPTRLEVGDSIYFDSAMAHAYIAAAPGRCVVLAICSGEEAAIIQATSGQLA